MAPLDFTNVIGPNGSNSDSKISDVMGVVKLKNNYPLLYSCSFSHYVQRKCFWGPAFQSKKLVDVLIDFSTSVKVPTDMAHCVIRFSWSGGCLISLLI